MFKSKSLKLGKKKTPKKSPEKKSSSSKLKSKVKKSAQKNKTLINLQTDPEDRSVKINTADPVEIRDPVSPKISTGHPIVSVTVSEEVSDMAVTETNNVVLEIANVPVKVVLTTEPGEIVSVVNPSAAEPPITSMDNIEIDASANTNSIKPVASAGSDEWVNRVKGSSKLLKKKGITFTLDSGEACVRISNSVIERNKKSWECFVLGQFYYDPPAQGTIHNIVNGIWSKYYRDISVTKMEGNAFLFRIPNAMTRSQVMSQSFWQIEGQTMFVAKWEPGVIPVKPELTSAPIWLELRKVPLQFFHEEGLERIAGLVGDPKFLHPSTANKTNIEVAKVFTLIDPRKPFPEAVNLQFNSGEIQRVLISCPWMPPVCAHCKGIGHSLWHCKAAPITLSVNRRLTPPLNVQS